MMNYSIKDYLSTRNALDPVVNASATKLAYLSNERSDTYQLFVRTLENGDVRQVTDYDDGIGSADFSPVDDDLILFTKDAGGDEQSQLYLLDMRDDSVIAVTDNAASQHFYGGWSRDGRSILYSSTERNGTDRDIYAYDVASRTRELIHEGTGSVAASGFSPSARYVVLMKSTSNFDNNLYLYDRDDKDEAEPRLITPHDGDNTYYAPHWLGDESGFFVISNQGNEFSCLYFYDCAADSLTLVREYGWDVTGLALPRSEDRLFVFVNEDGYQTVKPYRLEGRELRDDENLPLPERTIGGLDFSYDGTRAVYAGSSHDENWNIWQWNVADGTHEPLTDLAPAVPLDSFVTPSLIRFASFDGLEIPAFVYLPTDGHGRVPYPAIVSIHGGPEGQSRPGYAPLYQYWLSRGYAVIVPNVRGSSGYGRTYMALDDRDKRLDSVEDLRALHGWAAADDRIDESRLVLMGGSYGGYMVLAGLAFQPELWAAGVDTVGIANLVTFLENTSPYRRKLREAEYGYLSTDREFLERASPIHKADDITAPLFIIHGANDPRVPLSEAEQIHGSLKARGVQSQFLVYDDEGHGLRKLKNIFDAYPKIADFLEGVLGQP